MCIKQRSNIFTNQVCFRCAREYSIYRCVLGVINAILRCVTGVGSEITRQQVCSGVFSTSDVTFVAFQVCCKTAHVSGVFWCGLVVFQACYRCGSDILRFQRCFGCGKQCCRCVAGVERLVCSVGVFLGVVDHIKCVSGVFQV